MNKTQIFLAIFAIFLVATHLASALTIRDASTLTLAPSQEGKIKVDLENEDTKTIEDVSMSLELTGLPFIPVGSSEDSTDRLRKDKIGVLSFTLRAAPDAKPGDYKIPFTITAKNLTQPKKGTLGVRITGNSALSFTLSAEKPIVGERSKLTLKVINAGLTDARFVSLRVLPSGLTLLSEEQVYIGTVNSDDFETASFDVLFNQEQPHLTVFVTYKDFNNQGQTVTEDLAPTVYTPEKALQLGIIKKNNTFWYIVTVVVLLILWILWRSYRKRQRLKKSKELAARR
jgi:hypothetical protein